MTHRIYYTDASILGFDATVLRTVEHEGRPAAVLDRTAFYPTSDGFSLSPVSLAAATREWIAGL